MLANLITMISVLLHQLYALSLSFPCFLSGVGLPCGSNDKESASNTGDSGSIPGLERGNHYPKF